MCQPPSVGLSITLSVLAESAESSAALVVPSFTAGEVTDVEVVRAFAKACDVVTVEDQLVPAEVLGALEADGVVLRPSAAALALAQDKVALRRRLSENGLAVVWPVVEVGIVRELGVRVPLSPAGRASPWHVAARLLSCLP